MIFSARPDPIKMPGCSKGKAANRWGKRFAALIAAAVLLKLLIVAGAFLWIFPPDLPESLLTRVSGIEFCLRCGSQREARHTSILDTFGWESYFPIRYARPPENGEERARCSHLFANTHRKDTAVSFESPLIQRRGYGPADDSEFWENPVLIQCLSGVAATNVEHAHRLFREMKNYWSQVGIPEQIQRALAGGDPGLLKRLLIEAHEGSGRKLPERRRAQVRQSASLPEQATD